MINNALKSVPFITTIIIGFLFACGGLYLLAYWSTFGVDISNLIGIMDVPKSFILPTAFVHIGIIIYFAILSIMFRHNKRWMDVTTINKQRHAVFIDICNGAIVIILCTATPAVISGGYKFEPWFWGFNGFACGVLFFIRINLISFLCKLIPHVFVRLYVTFIIVWIPIVSFAYGKVISTKIYNNKEIRYIQTTITQSNITVSANNCNRSLKLLGILGNNFIASSLDNKKIVIYSGDSIKEVQLIEGGK